MAWHGGVTEFSDKLLDFERLTIQCNETVDIIMSRFVPTNYWI